MLTWSTASRAQRAAALAKIGTTIDLVVLDLKDAARGNPALEREINSSSDREQLELLALEWFGDLGNPQPTNRSDWLGWREAPGGFDGGPTFSTPDWPGGRLPPIEQRLDETPTVTVNDATPAAQRKRRHRPREPLPLQTVEQLEHELERRRAAGNPRRGPLTQQAIADRVGVDRHRVQQAEQLVEANWDLPKSHPDFSANDGVRWPTPDEALQLRGS